MLFSTAISTIRGWMCSLAAILENGYHGRHGTNPECLRSLKLPLWYIVWVCQVSCFYHKGHDFSVFCWTMMNVMLKASIQQLMVDTSNMHLKQIKSHNLWTGVYNSNRIRLNLNMLTDKRINISHDKCAELGTALSHRVKILFNLVLKHIWFAPHEQ